MTAGFFKNWNESAHVPILIIDEIYSLIKLGLITNYCLWTELYSGLIPNGGLALDILVL